MQIKTLTIIIALDDWGFKNLMLRLVELFISENYKICISTKVSKACQITVHHDRKGLNFFGNVAK